jgi:hypothetical protein
MEGTKKREEEQQEKHPFSHEEISVNPYPGPPGKKAQTPPKIPFSTVPIEKPSSCPSIPHNAKK